MQPNNTTTRMQLGPYRKKIIDRLPNDGRRKKVQKISAVRHNRVIKAQIRKQIQTTFATRKIAIIDSLDKIYVLSLRQSQL